jgi:hypothetical protein
MFPFHFTRQQFAKLVAAAFMAVQLLGWITLADASDVSPPTALPVGRRALREFDRFLDHHPLLESELRLNPALTGDNAYLKKHAELRDFLGANPEVIRGLGHHPRYFLFRALLRQASSPLRYSDIAQLREVFDAQPDLERALVQNPEAIRDPAFLQEHAVLRDFLIQHPVLGFEYLPWDQSAKDITSHDHPSTSSRNDCPVPRSRQRQ